MPVRRGSFLELHTFRLANLKCNCSHYGLLYHDSASSGFDDHHNVLADSPGMWWLLINGQGSNETGGNVPNGCNFSAPSCRGNNTIHHNFADATCNMTNAACMGKSGLAATGNGSCAVYDISFVPTSADFPPEARAIMSAAGPSGTLGPHGATIEWSEPVIIHGA